MSKLNRLMMLLLLSAGLALAGCGDDGGSTNPDATSDVADTSGTGIGTIRHPSVHLFRFMFLFEGERDGEPWKIDQQFVGLEMSGRSR